MDIDTLKAQLEAVQNNRRMVKAQIRVERKAQQLERMKIRLEEAVANLSIESGELAKLVAMNELQSI